MQCIPNAGYHLVYYSDSWFTSQESKSPDLLTNHFDNPLLFWVLVSFPATTVWIKYYHINIAYFPCSHTFLGKEEYLIQIGDKKKHLNIK